MNALELHDVSLTIHGRPLLGPLHRTVAPGEILVLLGPSGVGKSSLLAYLCGVLPPAIVGQGRIILGGEDLTSRAAHERHIGILFQDDLLFPHLSVGGNLAYGLRTPPGTSRRVRRGLIDRALAGIGLAGFADRDPGTLSGGQRARVALLRVLLSRPRALLLDEPFAHLDNETRDAVRRLVFAEARQRNLPTVLVTHDFTDVVAAGGPYLNLALPKGDSCSMPASSL